MYSLNKAIVSENVKIYVNGNPIPYSWNNYNSRMDALEDIMKGNISYCNPLKDRVEIREERVVIYKLEY